MINQTLLETPAERPATFHTGAPRRSTALLILSGLWLVIYFASLFAPPLLDDADGTHASAARHMALTGDLVTLRVDGIRYLEKPPLPYWLVAVSFRIFGFNTFAAHLPQAIGVLLLTLLGYRWAERAFNARTAFYTGLATLTSVGVFLFTRYFIPEVLLSLFLCTALYCLLRTLEGRVTTSPGAPLMQSHRTSGHSRDSMNHSSAHNPKSVISTGGGALAAAAEKSASRLLPPTAHAYIMWTALALAVLTKGLVALVFFFGTAIAYLILTGEYKQWRNLKPFTGAILFLLIAAPWHILAGLRNTGGMEGHGFFWFYFVNEHFLRFLGRRYPMDYNKLPSYLFWSLHLVWLFPWSLFCGALLLQAAVLPAATTRPTQSQKIKSPIGSPSLSSPSVSLSAKPRTSLTFSPCSLRSSSSSFKHSADASAPLLPLRLSSESPTSLSAPHSSSVSSHVWCSSSSPSPPIRSTTPSPPTSRS